MGWTAALLGMAINAAAGSGAEPALSAEHADSFVRCVSAAAAEFKVSPARLAAFLRREASPAAPNCEAERRAAIVLSAALADAKGNLALALSRIHAGPPGPRLRKALADLASRPAGRKR